MAETIDSVTNEPRLRETAARLFAEADWSEREPVTPGNDPYKAALGEIIAEKYRKTASGGAAANPEAGHATGNASAPVRTGQTVAPRTGAGNAARTGLR